MELQEDPIYQQARRSGNNNFGDDYTVGDWSSLLGYMKYGKDGEGIIVPGSAGLEFAPCIPAMTTEADELGLERCPQDLQEVECTVEWDNPYCCNNTESSNYQSTTPYGRTIGKSGHSILRRIGILNQHHRQRWI